MPKKGSKKKVGEADQLRLKHNRDALDAVDSVYTNYPNKGGKGLSDYSKEINAFLTRFGLVDASSKPVSSVIHKPRSRITVMVVGNHSSGKSSFINWYVGQENLLKTSMAIETKGITFVAKGNKEEEYGSDATLRKFPEILNVGERTGDPRIMKCISTMLSTSSERLFPLVTFVDTPGLVDTTEYPFDVNKGIEAMADHCDKILVFLDPMGKATCSRTMNVIRLLMKKCAEKTEFYLTKADSIGTAEDAMTVAIQICKDMGNATENNHNFKMPCIYLPSHATDDPHAAPNKIGDLCDEIVRCANMKAQSNMSRLKNDSDSLLSWIETVKKMDVEKKAAKGCRVQISRTLWVLVLSMVCLSFLWILVTFQSIVPDVVTETPLYGEIVAAVQPYVSADKDASSLTRLMSFVKFIGTFMVLTFMARFVGSRANGYPTLSEEELERIDFIQTWVKRAGSEKCDAIWNKFTGDVDGKKD